MTHGFPKLGLKGNHFHLRRCVILRAIYKAEELRCGFLRNLRLWEEVLGIQAERGQIEAVEKLRAARTEALSRELKVTIQCTTFCRMRVFP
jgi:hypothetical protein